MVGALAFLLVPMLNLCARCEYQTAYDHLEARNEKNKEKEVEEEPQRKKRKLEKEPEKGTQTKLYDFGQSSSASGSATAAFMRRHQVSGRLL